MSHRLSDSDFLKEAKTLSCEFAKIVQVGAFGLTDTEHARAASILRRLYLILNRVTLVSNTIRIELLQAGIALNGMGVYARRASLDIRRTASLVFATLFVGTCPPDAPRFDIVQQWLEISASETLVCDSDSATLAKTCEASGLAARHVSMQTPEKLDELAFVYYACAIETGRNDAFYRATVDPEAHICQNVPLRSVIEDDRARSLVEAADAELGQMAFRDLIISFRMPRGSVRARRTVLCDRNITRVAELSYPALLNRAYGAAMQMPSHVWTNGVIEIVEQPITTGDFLSVQSESHDGTDGFLPQLANTCTEDPFVVERSCALLAGLSLLIAADVEQVRGGDAFAGLVELPFIRTPPPGGEARRMALVNGEWIYYTPNVRGIRVHLRGRGLGALLQCATTLLDDM